jgi:guanosine-3',5'-bis(diphosphate) 3'-pyrophosphohydrolase
MLSDARKTDAHKSENMVSRAIALAADAHQDQYRWDGQPYIFHPYRVMHGVWDTLMTVDDGLHWAASTEAVAAAVLHDVVEDTHITLHGLGEMFPKRVVELVEYLTRRDGEEYAEFIERCCEDREAAWIKLCDVRDNLDGLPIDKIELYNRYIKAEKQLEGVV